MYYVYLLKLNDNTIYTGRTDELKQRFGEHSRGKVKSTKYKLPVLLIYYEAYINKQEAVDRELYLKTGDGRREIRRQLRNLFSEK
ncbi:GIY-YIG nuclease family protein [Candidatus Uhrbacteria bacterium]|nr:GIY-YIG nuclease family protein [Candidatus Uhrbacteria bacterium]